MRRFNYIAILTIALVSLCGCEHDTNLENEDININIPTDGYIFFDTEVNSRGVLIENYLQDNFKVLGYRYLNAWSSEEAQAKQTKEFSHNGSTITMGVFGNTPQEQLVEWKDNVHTYSPMKEWDKDLTYSFFAWYPSNIPSSGISHEGNPYVTYTLDLTDPANHIDVMTACVIDTKSSSSKSVSFNMQHRLSALDIIARSYVNADALNMNAGETAKVKINSVGIDFSNLLYDGATIPLNTRDNSETLKGTNTNNSDKSVSFSPIIGNVTMNYYENDEDIAYLTNDAGKTMLFIPQAESLTCAVNVSYDIVDGNGNVIQGYDDITSTTNISIKELKEGTYYYMLLNFTKSGVTVVVQEADEWKDKDVKHEFE